MASAGEVIDRIVATVNGRIILQSDLDEALSYEAVLSGRSLSQLTDDERRSVLDRLIDQELLRGADEIGGVPACLRAEVAARVAEARKQYSEAIADEGWQALLANFISRRKILLAHVEQEIDLLRLVDARLRPSVQIDSKSIEALLPRKICSATDSNPARAKFL